MDPQAPQVGGAEALQSQIDPALKDVVADLIHISTTEQEMHSNYSVSQCNAKLQELLDYTDNPAGKPERTIQDVVGEMFLVFHHRAQLQATERQSQIARLQSENSRLQSENSSLQCGNYDLRREVQHAQTELDRAQGECEIMFAGLQSAQRETENRCVGQASQVSIAAKQATQKSDIPDLYLVSPNVRDDQRISLASEANLSRRFEFLRLRDETTPDQQEMHVRSRAAPDSAISNLVVIDEYRAPPSARSWVGSALRHGTTPPSGISRPSLRFDVRRDEYPEVRNSTGSGPPLTSELRSRRVHDNRIPSPEPRGRSHSHCYGDLSDSGSSDSDGPRAHQHQGLRTRQLESLARDIECFDPSSQDSNVADYLREIERCLIDLPRATPREKLKLIWKTTARSVHVFMETLPPDTRDCYHTLRKALREEYSPFTDEASATLGAFAIMLKKA
ncbi:hypothetical protein F2P81_007448 [Scophthalmus maximus]|uniref:Uncharacterized protein n=1 Tax=Scophthalmus maximus TaxID=52904 RepID=A0A6A4SZE9_SCOMX|nr:hypothetical protein F2P81_007448 [Scophthalmus maximus]